MLELDTILCGFKLLETQDIPDVHGTGYIFEHLKSGARLCYIKSEDNNKVFSVSFKTPPADHCGTAHILEHSVLCGSRKYNVKDPFNELAKGSLNTFLNAMTFSDKTMYPVASCNEDDLHNLMDVYLDAVFYPNIYQQKEIFLQEGWRYVYDAEKDNFGITGVVYNEMKGALSDPESKLSGVIAEKMFGNSVYGFESGGHPTHIPELTYETFLNFHRTYYHPSNSYLYLYGNMDLERCLNHINEEYLSNFERITDLPTIEAVASIPNKEIQYDTYSVETMEEEKFGYLSYTFNVGKSTDDVLVMAIRILTYVLLETNASPIKKALIDAEICEEVEGWFDSSAYEMTFSIIGKNCEISRVSEFKEIINSTLTSIISTGLNNELLSSSIKRLEFLLKEDSFGSTPKGLVYGMNIMKNWLYGANPLDRLHSLRALETIKSPSYSWENLITSLFIENEKNSLLVFQGELDKATKDLLKEEESILSIKNNLSKKDFEQIAAEKKSLDIFQKLEDTQENLSKIPILDLDQVSSTSTQTKFNVSRVEECTEIFVPIESNGIVYAKLHFDTNYLPEELLPYAGLLVEILGRLDTEKYGFTELPVAINDLTGGFKIKHDIFSRESQDYTSLISFDVKFLEEDLYNVMEFILNILIKTKFQQTDNLNKLIKSAKINAENSILNHLHVEAIQYSTSNLFQGSQVYQMVSGISYYQFLRNCEKNFDTAVDQVVEKLTETAKLLFTQKSISLSFGCEKHMKNSVQIAIDSLIKQLPLGNSEKQQYIFTSNKNKTAITCDSAIQYNILTSNYKEAGYNFNGKLHVLRTILNQEYLWNKVRVQGGAYGAGCNFTRNGLAYFYSYRDPNVIETYTIYEDLYQDIESFSGSDRDMQKFILGTINRLDQPKTNKEMLDEAIEMNYQNISYKMIDLMRKEILETSSQDIRNFADLMSKLTQTENICSIGNEQKLESNANYFEAIFKLNI